MTREGNHLALEAFQVRVARTSVLVAVVLAGAVVAGAGRYTPVAGGLALGGAASLAAHWIKVRTLRQIGRGASARRASLAAIMRLAVGTAALAAAFATPAIDFWATAAGLLIANAVTVILAVRDARRHKVQT